MNAMVTDKLQHHSLDLYIALQSSMFLFLCYFEIQYKLSVFIGGTSNAIFMV
jgi:hypothetical protein